MFVPVFAAFTDASHLKLLRSHGYIYSHHSALITFKSISIWLLCICKKLQCQVSTHPAFL